MIVPAQSAVRTLRSQVHSLNDISHLRLLEEILKKLKSNSPSAPATTVFIMDTDPMLIF